MCRLGQIPTTTTTLEGRNTSSVHVLINTSTSTPHQSRTERGLCKKHHLQTLQLLFELSNHWVKHKKACSRNTMKLQMQNTSRARQISFFDTCKSLYINTWDLSHGWPKCLPVNQERILKFWGRQLDLQVSDRAAHHDSVFPNNLCYILYMAQNTSMHHTIRPTGIIVHRTIQ